MRVHQENILSLNIGHSAMENMSKETFYEQKYQYVMCNHYGKDFYAQGVPQVPCARLKFSLIIPPILKLKIGIFNSSFRR